MKTPGSAQMHLRPPVFAALDVDDPAKAISLAKALSGRVGGFKVGPRLSLAGGPELIRALKACGPLFLDHKFFDIPSTMESAVRAAFQLGADFVTVHAHAGSEALTRLAELEANFSHQTRPVRVLAVTVLTSFTTPTLPPSLQRLPIADQVDELADLAVRSGLSGLVCSPEEVLRLRARYSEVFLVVPGIRMPNNLTNRTSAPVAIAGFAGADDQKRVGTPGATFKQGASALVIGRPFIEAQDPAAVAESVLADLRQVGEWS